MSGKPSVDGVKAVVEVLNAIDAEDKEIERLTPFAQQLRGAEVKVANLRIELKRLIDGMDLSSTGNYGYESRLAWFLQEMRRQVK